MSKIILPVNGATRYSTGVRIDLVDADYLVALGQIMHVGAEKYGELNWRKGLEGEKGGINHAYQHLAAYVGFKPCDYGPREMHLAQVGINAMFEFAFERQRRLANEAVEAEKDSIAREEARKAEALSEQYRSMSALERKRFNKTIGLIQKR